MAKNRKTANTLADPTLPKTSIEIQGKSYTLCFDLASLAEAEMHFKSQGHEVNLLRALPELNLSSVMVIFPCAVRRFHPELSFEQAKSLVTLKNVYGIAAMVAGAWGAAVPKQEESEATENPQNP